MAPSKGCRGLRMVNQGTDVTTRTTKRRLFMPRIRGEACLLFVSPDEGGNEWGR